MEFKLAVQRAESFLHKMPSQLPVLLNEAYRRLWKSRTSYDQILPLEDQWLCTDKVLQLYRQICYHQDLQDKPFALKTASALLEITFHPRVMEARGDALMIKYTKAGLLSTYANRLIIFANGNFSIRESSRQRLFSSGALPNFYFVDDHQTHLPRQALRSISKIEKAVQHLYLNRLNYNPTDIFNPVNWKYLWKNPCPDGD